MLHEFASAFQKNNSSSEGDAEDEDEAEVPAICKELSNKAAQNELPKMPASISE